MSGRVKRRPGRELLEQLGVAIPADHARQTIAERYVESGAGRPEGRPWRVLDLGCGAGDSVAAFRAVDPAVEWTGVDLERSPEVDMRVRDDATFLVFDGVHLPCESASFDLVFCKQVLEHVSHPRPLLAEVRRVLVPEGRFCGSTSQLEPFHSYSHWNYTPLGFRALLAEAGLTLSEIRPGIDGPTLIASRLTGLRPVYAKWWGNRSPLNATLDAWARVARIQPQMLNATKLLFCGQFAFMAGVAGGPDAPGLIERRSAPE
jgi:SAM-dependent methyltransferase